MQIMVRTVHLWENTKQETSGVKINNLFPANTWGLNLRFQPTIKNYNDLSETVNFYVVCIVVCQGLGFVVSDGRTEDGSHLPVYQQRQHTTPGSLNLDWDYESTNGVKSHKCQTRTKIKCITNLL